MAYFSNGTEGECYQNQYCDRCEFMPIDENDGNCPIWFAHVAYMRDRHTVEAIGEILDALIPMRPHTFRDGLTLNVAAECKFFRHRTEPLPFDEANSDGL